MRNSKKGRSSDFLSIRWCDKLSADADGRGGVVPSTKNLSSQKFHLVTDRYDWWFQPYQHHCTASSVELSCIRYYTVGASGYY